MNTDAYHHLVKLCLATSAHSVYSPLFPLHGRALVKIDGATGAVSRSAADLIAHLATASDNVALC
jgi:hypothetical protein